MSQKEKLWNKDFIIACLTYFLIACAFFLLMPTIPLYLSEKLNVEPSKIGIVLSSYAIALLIVRPFSGFLVDVYSRKSLLLVGTMLFVAIFFGYYFAFTVIFFIILRFIHGLFWGLTAVSANTVAIDIIPSTRRAEGIGYFGVNGNIAMAIAPFLGVKLYSGYGFNALITGSIIMGIASILTASFIKVPKREKITENQPISLDRFILVKGLPIMGNQLLLSFGWGTLVAYAVLYGKDIGIENAGVFFLFLAAGIISSRITSGKLVDKGYLHQIMVIAIFLIGMGFIGFAKFHNVYSYNICAFMIGIGYGTLFPALQTIYINMAPASQRGTANSTYLTGFDLGIGLGMLIGAYLGGKYGFANMYLITGLGSFVALLIYWFNSRKVYEKHRLS
jgi:MFS family permease